MANHIIKYLFFYYVLKINGGFAMEIISRKKAQKNGLKMYFTGEPCRHGHICERRTTTGRCILCSKEYYLAHKKTMNKQAMKYYEAHKEQLKASFREYQRTHKSQMNGYFRKWYKLHKAKKGDKNGNI